MLRNVSLAKAHDESKMIFRWWVLTMYLTPHWRPMSSASLCDSTFEKAWRLWRIALPLLSRKIQATPQLTCRLTQDIPTLHFKKPVGCLDHETKLSRIVWGICDTSAPGKLTSNHTFASSLALVTTDTEEYWILSKVSPFRAFHRCHRIQGNELTFKFFGNFLLFSKRW